MTKGRVFVLLAVPAVVAALAATREWATATVADPLNPGTASATGTALSPGVLGLLLVITAALIAVVSTGTWARRVSLAMLLLAVTGAITLTVAVVTQPEQSLGRAVVTSLGRAGEAPAQARLTMWPWAMLVSLGVLLVAAVVAVQASRRWTGLSQRFEQSPARAETLRPPSAWDDLSAGVDPTLDDPGSGR